MALLPAKDATSGPVVVTDPAELDALRGTVSEAPQINSQVMLNAHDDYMRIRVVNSLSDPYFST